MTSLQALRIVIVAPESLTPAADDDDALVEAERSRSLRIGLLANGYNIVAVLPIDAFLPERIAQIQPDMIVVDAQSQARDTLEHVVMSTRDERRPIVLFTDDADTAFEQLWHGEDLSWSEIDQPRRRGHRRRRDGLRRRRPGA